MSAAAAGNGEAEVVQKASLGMWIFLASEVLFFGAIFMGFLVYRYGYRDAFVQGSEELDVMLGGINTLVLLTSSLLVAMAVALAEEGRRLPSRLALCATVMLGLGFLSIKGVEYSHEIEKGLAPWVQSNFTGQPAMELFYNFYFAMTGLHALHLSAGIGAVLVMVFNVRAGNDHLVPRLKATGLYWHFVDIVWVFLFPMLYLIR